MTDTRLANGAPAWVYELWCQVLRRPRLLRAVASVIRRWPIASQLFTVVARRDAVVAAFLRSGSFSNTAHAPNLVAGEFAIGIQDGPRYLRERTLVEAMLRTSVHLGRASAVLSRQHIRTLERGGAEVTFDLVDDYLGPVAWRAMKRCFGIASDTLTGGGAGLGASAEGAEKQLLLNLRYVGSHLLVGGVAPSGVQCRAEAAAAVLNTIVAARTTTVRHAIRGRMPAAASDAAVQRNTTGLMWVAHPATVQAGVHMVLKLLARPDLHRQLRSEVREVDATEGKAWLDQALRTRLGHHVLELLRFRPPFPVLSRDVPRDSSFDTGDGCPALASAGQAMKLMVIGALFDPSALEAPGQFRPERTWRDQNDRYMVFGFGHRSCPAKEHVLEMLVSILIGLLILPRPFTEGRGSGVLEYDGPAASHLRLRF